MATGAAGWVRRLFAPALTVGAALAMVGLVGTATPILDGAAGGATPGLFDVGTALQGGDGDSNYEAFSSGGEVGAPAEEPGSDLQRDTASPAALAGEQAAASESAQEPDAAIDEEQARASSGPLASDGSSRLSTELPAERSPWPMVLFAGVALMVGAGLLRWILAPRAG
jgi:hypothetical protein